MIACFVKRRYRPKFVSEDDRRFQEERHRLVLTREEYEYRKNAEMLIYEMAGFFAFNIPLAIFIRLLMKRPLFDLLFVGALWGIGSAVLCFLGVVFMVVKDVRLGR